jgi:hypothetical protein
MHPFHSIHPYMIPIDRVLCLHCVARIGQKTTVQRPPAPAQGCGCACRARGAASSVSPRSMDRSHTARLAVKTWVSVKGSSRPPASVNGGTRGQPLHRPSPSHVHVHLPLPACMCMPRHLLAIICLAACIYAYVYIFAWIHTNTATQFSFPVYIYGSAK